jgi:hypothetical protein
MSFDVPSRSERPVALPERYRVRRHIATGGMASVWCAEDLVLGRRVAVKVLAERFAHDPVAVQRFKREARAAARVSGHPHVVTIYDVGEVAEDASRSPADTTHWARQAFIVMEFLAGGTVADALHHDSVRRHEALRWLGEAASALDHAHARGIVHRDIKPANFLLDRSRVLHVADFGIAHLETEETITTSDQLFGTAAYLSPEQALGREATGASDRYALAVAAFELLAGRRPFSAPHFSAQARQHIEEPPPAASELDRTLPPAVDEVLFAGLAKDPAARPGSAGEFVAALGDALSGRPPAGRSAGRPGSRHPAAVPRPDPAAPAASTAAARRRVSARTPATRSPAPPPDPGHPRRAVALGALLVTLLLTAAVTLAATRGSPGHGHRVAERPARATHHHRTARARPLTHRARTTTTRRATPTTTAAPTPVELQDQGHEEMLDGDWDSAIPTLREAVAAAPSDSLTYAYALYDLGRSEMLSGDPEAAIPVLRARLRIPDQQGTVKALLDQALAAAGESGAPASGGAAPTRGVSGTSAPSTPASPGSGSGGAGLSGAGGAATGGSGATTPNQTRAHPHGFSPLTLITAVAG